MHPCYLLKQVWRLGMIVSRWLTPCLPGFGDRRASFFASGVSGIINCLATIPVQFWLVDKWGRRPSSIAGGFIMGLCMTTIGALYASGISKTDAGRWTIIVMIYASIFPLHERIFMQLTFKPRSS